MGGSVGINALKRFVSEQCDVGVLKNISFVKPSGKRVAIIGSGPAGLTAVYYLARIGHGVTVFEVLSEPGGMMRFGIPRYRLPIEILNKEIDFIKKVGVEIKTGIKIESINQLFEQGYNSVFIAIGAQKSLRMDIEGEEDPGVIECISFLRKINSGEKVSVGNRRVVVIGGGNTAIDSARVALRLGAKEVKVLYRRSRDEMLANPSEVDEALLEGIEILFLVSTKRIFRKNGKLMLECIRTKLGEIDDTGRKRPEPVLGSEFSFEVDMVISAIGELPEIPGQFELSLTKMGTIKVDFETLATEREGVFAGGYAITGPSSVIDAIAMGRKAASSIDKYL